MASLSSRPIHLSPLVKQFVATLSDKRKLDLEAVLVYIAKYPGDGPGMVLGFPYQPWARCLGFRGFWIVYRVMDDNAVQIGSAVEVP